MTIRTLQIIHRRTLQVDFLGTGQKKSINLSQFFYLQFLNNFFFIPEY